jgi:hypothetical protein
MLTLTHRLGEKEAWPLSLKNLLLSILMGQDQSLKVL